MDDGENIRKLQQWRATYLGMVACIDDNVGRILEHLDAHGLAANTLVVFTADHGEYLGEHGLMGKNLLYRSAYHVPCVMRLPGTITGGGVIEQMITQNDFAATLCALAGVDAPPRHCGRDLRPLLNDGPIHWRDEVHQHHPKFELAGLLTPRWHMILHREGEHRLFDLATDPDERTDCFADASRSDVVADLAARILAHHEDIGSPAVKWLRECPVGSKMAQGSM